MSARMPEGRLAYFQPRCTSIHSAWRHCVRIRMNIRFHPKAHCNVRQDEEQITTLHGTHVFRKTTFLSMLSIREASRDTWCKGGDTKVLHNIHWWMVFWKDCKKHQHWLKSSAVTLWNYKRLDYRKDYYQADLITGTCTSSHKTSKREQEEWSRILLKDAAIEITLSFVLFIFHREDRREHPVISHTCTSSFPFDASVKTVCLSWTQTQVFVLFLQNIGVNAFKQHG